MRGGVGDVEKPHRIGVGDRFGKEGEADERGEDDDGGLGEAALVVAPAERLGEQHVDAEDEDGDFEGKRGDHRMDGRKELKRETRGMTQKGAKGTAVEVVQLLKKGVSS